MKKLTLILMLIIGFFNLNAQESGGKLVNVIIPAPSLTGNLLQTPDKQPISIYLPESYDKSDKKYPVVYYLPGYGSYTYYYTQFGVFKGFLLKRSMDKLISEGKLKDMIVVIPNAVNIFAGHFYVNSPVSGNWEDFIVKDLVSYIDKTYRTLRKSTSRGISGHSMGGFGALNIAMLHPDVFGLTYAIAPGLFDKGGLSKHAPLAGKKFAEVFFKKQKELNKMKDSKALASLLSFGFYEHMILADYETAFCFAYGLAFSPNPNIKPPYINYLYDKKNGKLVRNKENWKAYESGFGNLEEKVNKYKENLLKLKAIGIDYGNKDYYKWIPEGCKYFSQLLKKNNIKHKLSEYKGGHEDKLRERMEGHMFPFFSENLDCSQSN